MTLKGDVEWQYQKLEAERAVRGLWGVKGVSNFIIVKPAASPSDLKKKIEVAATRTAQVDASNIKVEVLVSRAILKVGCAPGRKGRRRERQAWLAPGITSVDNQITLL